MTNMKELQDVLVMLGLNVKLCPKLFSAKIDTKDVIKEEVSEKTPEELEAHFQWVQMIKKKSTIVKTSSSGKFRHSRCFPKLRRPDVLRARKK